MESEQVSIICELQRKLGVKNEEWQQICNDTKKLFEKRTSLVPCGGKLWNNLHSEVQRLMIAEVIISFNIWHLTAA